MNSDWIWDVKTEDEDLVNLGQTLARDDHSAKLEASKSHQTSAKNSQARSKNLATNAAPHESHCPTCGSRRSVICECKRAARARKRREKRLRCKQRKRAQLLDMATNHPAQVSTASEIATEMLKEQALPTFQFIKSPPVVRRAQQPQVCSPHIIASASSARQKTYGNTFDASSLTVRSAWTHQAPNWNAVASYNHLRSQPPPGSSKLTFAENPPRFVPTPTPSSNNPYIAPTNTCSFNPSLKPNGIAPQTIATGPPTQQASFTHQYQSIANAQNAIYSAPKISLPSQLMRPFQPSRVGPAPYYSPSHALQPPPPPALMQYWPQPQYLAHVSPWSRPLPWAPAIYWPQPGSMLPAAYGGQLLHQHRQHPYHLPAHRW